MMSNVGDPEDSLWAVAVHVSVSQIESFIKTINNGYEVSSGEAEPLTIQELMSNDRLMDYICTGAVEDGIAMYDPFEFWCNDGWCDWQDYRQACKWHKSGMFVE